MDSAQLRANETALILDDWQKKKKRFNYGEWLQSGGMFGRMQENGSLQNHLGAHAVKSREVTGWHLDKTLGGGQIEEDLTYFQLASSAQWWANLVSSLFPMFEVFY